MLTKRRLVAGAFLAVAAIAVTMTPVFTAYKATPTIRGHRKRCWRATRR